MIAPNVTTNEQYAAFISQDAESAVNVLKHLKNELIGHPERKRQAISSGVIPNLLGVLQASSNYYQAKVQAAIILASLCQGNLNYHDLLPDAEKDARGENQIVSILLNCVSSPDAGSALVLPCLRALSLLIATGADASIIWSSYLTPLTTILQATLASAKSHAVQESTYVASILATYDTGMQAEDYSIEILLGALIGILVTTTHLGQRMPSGPAPQTRLLETTLQALAALTRSNLGFSNQLATAGLLSQYRCASDETPVISTLLRLVRHESNSLRLAASSCLTNLYKHGVIPRKHHKEIALSMLPILVRLFDDEELTSQAPFVLTDLVKDSDDMQRAACEAGAVQKLSTILQQRTETSDDKVTESALLALAAITLHRDEFRRQVIDARVVPLIVSAMGDSSARVKAAACHCARSLSRSVAILRTGLIDAGISNAVLRLMLDPDLNVKTSATAAICNLVLDFSPMRSAILDSGIIPLLGRLSQDSSAELRLNAVWAIKHIVYAATTPIKDAVLAELTPALLMRLCEDAELAVQEQACEVIRNLVCGKPDNIDLLVDNIGLELLADFLIRKLNSPSTEINVSAIYSLVHLAAGSERHRMIIMQRSNILEALKRHLASDSDEIKIGAVWTIINLTWSADDITTVPERRARINALEDLGFLDRLLLLVNDRSLDVRERVKTALAQME